MKKSILIALSALLTLGVFAEQVESEVLKDTQIQELAKTKKIHPTWLHRVQGIQDHGSFVEVDNGMIFEVGSGWAKTAKKWESGDIVRLVFDEKAYFNPYKIKNLTKDEAVWGVFYNLDLSKAEDMRSIVAIEDHFSTLLLDDGTILKTNIGWFRDFKVGDMVTTISYRGQDNPHILLNFMLQQSYPVFVDLD